MRNRGSAVIIENKKVALIKRIKADSIYYVFPGGGIEQGETTEEATKREAYEELGVEIKVKDCIAEVDFRGKQFFFLGDIIGGAFGTGQGEEFLGEDSDSYIPMWVDIDDLSAIDIRPKEVAEKVQSLLNNGHTS